MDTETVEAKAVTVKGRFCGSPKLASGGYIAGLLGRLMEGPARVNLEQPVPVEHALGIERLSDGAIVLTEGGATLAHASCTPSAVARIAPHCSGRTSKSSAIAPYARSSASTAIW